MENVTADLGDNLGNAEGQPLVEGDGAVAVLVHLLEHGRPLSVALEGDGHAKPG